MFYVVFHHLLWHGGVLFSVAPKSTEYAVVWFFNTLAFCGVNCFALLSGYVGYNNKIKYSNIIHLWIHTSFWCILFLFISYFTGESITLKKCLAALLSVFYGGYWYVNAYFVVFFFMPLINSAVRNTETIYIIISTLALLILFSFCGCFLKLYGVGNGYTFIWLSFLFYLGACLQKYKLFLNIPSFYFFILYIISAFSIMFLIMLIQYYTSHKAGSLYAYNSPLMLLESVSLFLAFRNLHLSTKLCKIISHLSPLAFGVYLIHCQNLFMQYFVYGKTEYLASSHPLISILIIFAKSFLIYVVCMILDYLRFVLFRYLKVKSICCKIEQFILDLISGILIKCSVNDFK